MKIIDIDKCKPHLGIYVMSLVKTLSFSILICCNSVSAHFDEAYSTRSDESISYNNWQKKLENERGIESISIPGTHDSGSLYGGDIVRTQSKSIDSQLQSGIRFLDIRLRHIDNVMAIHHDFVYQHLGFGDVLSQLEKFLAENPSEFVLMRVKEDYDPANNSRTFEDTFYEYMVSYSKIIYKPSNEYFFPKVKDVRGKVIFLDQLPRTWKYGTFGIKYPQMFNIQDDYSLSSNWDLYKKWESIKKYLEYAKGGKTGIINYLSGSGGSFPYFVASGHSSPDMGAPRLLTGATTPGWWYLYPEFPRVSCFIGICSIAFEGSNVMTRNWIQKNKPKYVGIVVGDFMGPSLIKEIIDTNFR
ncbi:phosphatidylinositol-specific phospholipase C [Escherichia coli]|uniref:phosphatidylinositol-specific phospholipase C n=1 Tax=Escherichia coli TaxID=562 RepID=UPI0018DF0D63|nr:phosphatidylinositol-specific phospholipase C [Escherichia coli]EJV3518209.1 phosphatidylinositol-specific phospholipase C [Escherichia coli]MDA6825738.1 phosphatidylinositol-specific phospholipase C [Escherichia coli]MDO2886382.1 phosphatidylinositol-specific phospholipase C [Escherichia coli]HCN2465729.1 phosphatidylinositol-specific phospholipase C [Escherichia coli]HDX3030319.1 phosphatidylinositol-specific phospholipase C [Escherichia coli]